MILIKIIKGKKTFINKINKLTESKFNGLNEHFISEYKKASFFDRLTLRKNLHFFIDKKSEINGYIWIDTLKSADIQIRSLFIKEPIDDQALNTLDKFLNDFDKVKYISYKDSLCNEMLKKIGFKEDLSILDMEINLKKFDINRIQSFKPTLFVKRNDEWIRAKIQNSIFYNASRVPLTINDIELDMLQEYYLDEGSYFLNHHGKKIGYGQLIDDGGELYLVNFGIMSNYRNKGLGKYFLKFLLNKAYEMGYNKMKIKVFKDNLIARKLYSDIGFKEVNDSIYWVREIVNS